MNNKKKKKKKEAYYMRFDPFSRFLHLLIIISFLSLAITGMIIKFSGIGIFQDLSKILGGYAVTGIVHRFAALITFTYFALHIGYLLYKKFKQKRPAINLFVGERTLVPRKVDLIEFGQTVKWFIGLGPRPNYGRWTYWEKFDYFAVFWGVAIIGASGLMLWFPEFFTSLGIPGEFINVATIIHSDEALLAVGFIFTVHFYNSHFRPDKFPMDTVIFTGKMPLEELKNERPREYELFMNSPYKEDFEATKPPVWFERAARIFGFCALSTGIIIIIMIIYSMIFLYR